MLPRRICLSILGLVLVLSAALQMQADAQSMHMERIYPRFAIGVTGVYATIESLEVVVSDVAVGSPADGAGMEAGDVLTSINGDSLAVADPRIPLGLAIGVAEGGDGELVFGVQGKPDAIVTIPVIGSYVSAWPAVASRRVSEVGEDRE